MTDEPNLPNGLSDGDCEDLLAGRRTDSPVGGVLHALQGPLGGALPGEAAAMAAFRAHGAGAVPITRRGRASARVVAAGIGTGVLLVGGVAAAASGTVRDDIATVIGVHHHSSPQRHDQPPVTVSPTPSAPTPSPTSTSAVSPTGHGKAHAGHGKGRGIGETAQPTHPAHPSHPAHPTQAASSTHRAHPTRKPHPTQAATPTHKAHPTKRAHPTQAANSTAGSDHGQAAASS